MNSADVRTLQIRRGIQPRTGQITLWQNSYAAEHALIKIRQLPPVSGDEVCVSELCLHQESASPVGVQ
jgi:hypothetical protein